MKKYYYLSGTEKFGPFTFDELKSKNIHPNTLIWADGMPSWQEARFVAEINTLFISSPPPPPPPFSNQFSNHNVPPPIYAQQPSPKKGSSAVLITFGIIGIIVIVVIGIAFVSESSRDTNYGSKVVAGDFLSRSVREKTPEEIRQDLKSKEEAELLDYLSLSYDVLPTLGLRARIKGKVTNSASIAKLKDVVIRMTFYTKTDTEISTEDKTMYEFVNPNSSKDFDWRIMKPDKTSKIGMRIVSASVVD